MNPSLPVPDADALAHSILLKQEIRQEIIRQQGWISFAQYMHLALYAPGLGYYSGGAKKFGASGDFVTAPEMSPLFGRSLARQVAQVLQHTGGNILELGAGSGQLTITLLQALADLDCLPERYYILEVSAHLREEQRSNMATKLPGALFSCVDWLDGLPQTFDGLILANEVLDALPVHVLRTELDGYIELGVKVDGEEFAWSERLLQDHHLQSQLGALNLPPDYTTELCPAAGGLTASLCATLNKGVLLLIDYGFPAREYYHPQRNEGTLMCHYRHFAHSDPFLHPGLQDITAHVDFSGVAHAALEAGAELCGYCHQAQFLINCGITELLTSVSADDAAEYLPMVAQVQKLLSPAEMGELFKVIAFGKQVDYALLGFVQGDKSYTL